jgi:hypothetical protein
MRWKVLGLAVLAIPLLVITLFAVGEGFGGESAWWGHLIQLAIGLAAFVGGWFAPIVVGPLLVLTGVAFTVVTLTNLAAGGVVSSALVILWLPMIISGALLTVAGSRQRVTPS